MLAVLSHLIISPLCCILLWSCCSCFVPFLSSQRPRQRTEKPQEDGDFLELDLAVIDIFLVLLFIIQHKVMAASWFKKALAYCNIVVVERLIYIAATSVSLMVMMHLWKPIEGWTLWYIDSSESFALWLFFTLLHALAWLILFLEVLVMDPLEMIGIKQIWEWDLAPLIACPPMKWSVVRSILLSGSSAVWAIFHFNQWSTTGLSKAMIYYYFKGFSSPFQYMSHQMRRLYSRMRHSGTASLFVILWFHPHMTLDRFILALLLNMFLYSGFPVTYADYKYFKTEFRVKKVTYQLERR